LNISVFFHRFTKEGGLNHKNHAQDGGTLIGSRSASRNPAMVFAVRMAPSFRSYGHLARHAQLPDCRWALYSNGPDRIGKRLREFPQNHAQTQDHASQRRCPAFGKIMQKRVHLAEHARS
jgi:hypothetical protein